MTHEQLQDAHIAALREIVEQRTEIERLMEKVEELLRRKDLIERAYRGYGTPEEEAAKPAAEFASRVEIERLQARLAESEKAAYDVAGTIEHLQAQLATAKGEVWDKVMLGYVRYKQSLIPKPGGYTPPPYPFEVWCQEQKEAL